MPPGVSGGCCEEQGALWLIAGAPLSGSRRVSVRRLCDFFWMTPPRYHRWGSEASTVWGAVVMRVHIASRRDERARKSRLLRRRLGRLVRVLGGVPVAIGRRAASTRAGASAKNVAERVVPSAVIHDRQMRAAAIGMVVGLVHVAYALINIVAGVHDSLESQRVADPLARHEGGIVEHVVGGHHVERILKLAQPAKRLLLKTLPGADEGEPNELLARDQTPSRKGVVRGGDEAPAIARR